MRIPIILAVVALALAGCNANQAVNPSSQTSSQSGPATTRTPILTIPPATRRTNTGRGGGH